MKAVSEEIYSKSTQGT